MNAVDLVVLLLLTLAQPIYGALNFRQFRARAEAGHAPQRTRMYRRAALTLWISFGVFLASWLLLQRPVTDLGIVIPGGIGFWTGLVAVAMLTWFLAASWRSARRTSATGGKTQSRCLEHMRFFLPHTRRELHQFFTLSATAGIVEEIVYRGYLIWLFGLYMPLWAAALLSSLVFGLGHSYQGIDGGIRTGLLGLMLALLYLGSGSIWLPILAHALIDILQGATIRELLRGMPVRQTPVDVST
jgi:membrane protease YdiL (CAAX protease family)